MAGERPERGDREPPADLEAVFADLRQEAAGARGDSEVGARHLRLGEFCLQAGRTDLARRALTVAAGIAPYRFDAARQLAELAEASGETEAAIGWYEQAADAAAPSTEAGHRVLYALAGVLEQAGLSARALAVLLELQGVAGSSYEDSAARVARLSGQLEGG